MEKPTKVVVSKGNPILYIDDDLFGFMITDKTTKKRYAPIKTDGIVALKHCEITRDFAARFDPTGKQMPSPFEIEVADFIGQNNWILTENIGKFEEEELTSEMISESPVKLTEKKEKEKKVYYLPNEITDATNKKYGRKNRLRAFLEVLLKERYTFPRSATSLHQPHYYYAIILKTERLLPLFTYIDYEIENGNVILDLEKIDIVRSWLESGEELEIIDFENKLEKLATTELKNLGITPISPKQTEIDKVINGITNYLIRDS